MTLKQDGNVGAFDTIVDIANISEVYPSEVFLATESVLTNN